MTIKKPTQSSSASWIREVTAEGDKVWAFFWISSKLREHGVQHTIISDRLGVSLRAYSCILVLNDAARSMFELKTKHGVLEFPLTDAGADKLRETIIKETLWVT